MNRTIQFVLIATVLPLTQANTQALSQDAGATNEDLINVSAEVEAGAAAFKSGDVIAAMRHYRTAADAGSNDAKVRLAWILDQSEDNVGAFRLYSEAAEAGDPAGQFGLAELYANGEGIKRNVRRAVDLFEAAAAQGHVRAMTVLVSAYAEGGLGLVPNADRSDYWQTKLAETQQAENEQ